MFFGCFLLHLRSHDFYGVKPAASAMTLPTWALDYPPLEAAVDVTRVGWLVVGSNFLSTDSLLLLFGYGNNMGEHIYY